MISRTYQSARSATVIDSPTTNSRDPPSVGRRIRFSIVAPGGMLARIDGSDRMIADEPGWAAALRSDSGMDGESEAGGGR
jgi:hypothetical protein